MKYLSISGLVTLFVITMALPTANAQTTWRVPEDAATIQAAIEAALDGDTIILTEPLYTGDGNRDVDFMGKAVTVRSSSGNPEYCVIDCQGSSGDPHRGFVFESGEGQGSRLVGITITNGYLLGSGFGGAVYILDSSPEILDCRFIGNNVGGKGGGIFCSNSFATISNCLFESNSADGGGGMSCTRNDAPSGPSITHCLFRLNVADFGGGFEARNYSTPELEFCTFSSNTANGGGGGVGSDNAVFTMRYCTLNGNSAGFSGGGIVGSFPEGTSVENTLISNSTGGEAVSAWDNEFITLTCCNIYGNAGGDWVGIIADQYPGADNLSEDPQFCSSIPDEHQSWVLQSDSPCAENQPACGQIGAWPIGCQTVHTDRMRFGGVKALYR